MTPHVGPPGWAGFLYAPIWEDPLLLGETGPVWGAGRWVLHPASGPLHGGFLHPQTAGPSSLALGPHAAMLSCPERFKCKPHWPSGWGALGWEQKTGRRCLQHRGLVFSAHGVPVTGGWWLWSHGVGGAECPRVRYLPDSGVELNWRVCPNSRGLIKVH